MPKAVAYHRPATLEEALTLLADPGRVILGGGTVVNTPGGDLVEVVDLQALGLTRITMDGERARCGAMTTLGHLVDHDGVPSLIRDAARRQSPSALRNQATIGGVIAGADPESVLLGALAVSAATVELTGPAGSEWIGLGDVLAQGTGGRIITAVEFATTGGGVIVATGRTPADTPIVAAVARRDGDAVTIALTGVAGTVVLVDPARLDELDPPGDFRGSAAYRTHLATVLTGRALAEVT